MNDARAAAVEVRPRQRWMVVCGSLWFAVHRCHGTGSRPRHAWTRDKSLAARYCRADADRHAARFWGAEAVPA